MKLNRKNKLLIGLCTVAAILIIKLFSIQILDDKYKTDAANNSMVYSTIYPTRGIINDRYGNILVGNKAKYYAYSTLMPKAKKAKIAIIKKLR